MQASNTLLEIILYNLSNNESLWCVVCIRYDGCDELKLLGDGVTIPWFCQCIYGFAQLASVSIYEAQQKPRRQRTLMCEVTIVFYRLNALRWRAYLSSPKE